MSRHLLDCRGERLSPHQAIQERSKPGRAVEFPEKDPIIHREGDKLIIKGAPPRSLRSILSELTPIDEEVADIGDPPPEPEPVSGPGLES